MFLLTKHNYTQCKVYIITGASAFTFLLHLSSFFDEVAENREHSLFTGLEWLGLEALCFLYYLAQVLSFSPTEDMLLFQEDGQ